MPSYFVGNLTAKTVFVMLNPGYEESTKNNNKSNYENVRREFENEISELPVEDRLGKYLDHAINFGKYDRYRPDNFDTKQAAFLYAFNIKDLKLPEKMFWELDESGKQILNKHLQMEAKESVLMHKLQLELFPYGSRKFDTGKVKKCSEILPEYVELLLETITAAPRELVVFGGGIFVDLFKEYNRLKENITFQIGKNEKFGGIMEKVKLSCCTVTINWKGTQITGLIANSFPMQSLPNAPRRMYAYGEECRKLIQAL